MHSLQAGIRNNNDDLAIALEPEAASLYIRKLQVQTAGKGGDVHTTSFDSGSRYMVIDAGGNWCYSLIF